MIPLKHLRKICDGCQKHIFFLLEEATKQHNSKNYSLAIFLTIIALEETSKFAVYADHLRQLKDVSNDMEKKLTRHNYKILKIFKTEVEKDAKISKLPKSKLLIPKMLGSLNFVKQFILYYDKIGDTNMTLNEYFLKHEMTINNLGHYSTFLWRFTNILYLSESLKNQYARIDGNIYSDSNVLNSENYKIIKNAIDEFTNLNLPGSEDKALLVIDELKNLAKRFDKYYEYS